jgi:uncharacterized membrane protein
MEIGVLVVTVLLTTLSTGVYYCFSTSINWSLHRLKDRDYLRTMQYINQVIQNPLFLLPFMLPVVLLPFVTFAYGGEMASLKFILLAIASLFYIFGMFGITMAGNVPLNVRLDHVDLKSADAELKEVREWYEKPWNRLHTLRTLTGVVSVICLTWAILL